MAIPNRTYSRGTQYRYGFNGKEKDSNINSAEDYNFGMRIYNPQIGRFLSIDPLTSKLPNITPYSFAGNNPVYLIDHEGKNPVPFLLAANLLSMKLYSTITQKVVFETVGFAAKVGVGLAGAGVKASTLLAVSPNGNYAIGISSGGFADFFSAIGGVSNGNNAANGNSYIGASVGVSFSFGASKTSQTKTLAGLSREFDMDVIVGGGTLVANKEGEAQGVSGSGGKLSLGLGAGMGTMNTNTNLFIFNNSDLVKVAEESASLAEDYASYKASSKFEDVTINNTSTSNAKSETISYSVTGKNKATGKTETLATHTLIKVTKRDDNTYSTDKAKDVEKDETKK